MRFVIFHFMDFQTALIMMASKPIAAFTSIIRYHGLYAKGMLLIKAGCRWEK